MDGDGHYNASEGGGCIIAKDHDRDSALIVNKAHVSPNSFGTAFNIWPLNLWATYPFYRLGDWINVTYVVNYNELKTCITMGNLLII